jgi:hypothetical protein
MLWGRNPILGILMRTCAPPIRGRYAPKALNRNADYTGIEVKIHSITPSISKRESYDRFVEVIFDGRTGIGMKKECDGSDY